MDRVLRGDLTLSELTRELAVSASVVRQCMRLVEQGSTAAMRAKGDVVPAHRLREAESRIRELERALGRKTMEVEILQAAQEEVKKRPRWYGVSTR
jgi:transposase